MSSNTPIEKWGLGTLKVLEYSKLTINLASGTETRVRDLANQINELTGNHNGVEFLPNRGWDKITRRRASIEKVRKVLGYQSKTSIEDGSRKFMGGL